MAWKAAVFGNATLNNNRKFIHVAAFTSRPSELGDSIKKVEISAAAWMNLLLFVKVTFPAYNWYLAKLQAACGQRVRALKLRSRTACFMTILQDKCYCL